MFEIDGESLNISTDMDAESVEQLRQFVQPRIEYIEHIGIQGALQPLGSSSLLQLLAAIKRSHPRIRIDLLECALELPGQGTQHWRVP